MTLKKYSLPPKNLKRKAVSHASLGPHLIVPLPLTCYSTSDHSQNLISQDSQTQTRTPTSTANYPKCILQPHKMSHHRAYRLWHFRPLWRADGCMTCIRSHPRIFALRGEHHRVSLPLCLKPSLKSYLRLNPTEPKAL